MLGRNIRLALFVILALQACASGEMPPHKQTAEKERALAEMVKRQKAFINHNPAIQSRLGNLEWRIGLAQPLKALEEPDTGTLAMAGTSLGFIPLGLVAPPVFASALVVGGALIAPLGAYVYAHEKGIRDAINDALTQTKFTAAVDAALQARLGKAAHEKPAAISILIQALGMVASTQSRHYCFVVSADLTIRASGIGITKETLRISETDENADAPPPQCASLEHFAENDAALLRTTLAEYAEMLAVMSVNRLPEGAE